MKSVLWFLIGVIGGFVAAHFLNKDPRGHEALSLVDARVDEFAAALREAFHAEEARLSTRDDH